MLFTDPSHSMAPVVAVLADSIKQQPQAKALATRLQLPLATESIQQHAVLFLTVTAERLELRRSNPRDEGGADEGGAVYVDFVTGKNAFRRKHGGGLRQSLARAVGLRGHRPLSILDATPGLGQDAFVLASLGGEVQMVERSPVVVALLADGLHRLANHAQQTGGDHLSMTLIQADARQFLENLCTKGNVSHEKRAYPDVIYLDPMYPHRDGSALVKKEMRRLRTLVGHDNDAPEILAIALRCAQKRVVVKRPRLAPPLAGTPPTMIIPGKNTRFDVYLAANTPLKR